MNVNRLFTVLFAKVFKRFGKKKVKKIKRNKRPVCLRSWFGPYYIITESIFRSIHKIWNRSFGNTVKSNFEDYSLLRGTMSGKLHVGHTSLVFPRMIRLSDDVLKLNLSIFIRRSVSFYIVSYSHYVLFFLSLEVHS